jgi:hypothetical protein
MATNTKNIMAGMGQLVLPGRQSGVTVIPDSTPLTRLNYFDGKFLRADDLRAEQIYQRRLVQLSNQAGPLSIAYGYDLSLASGGDLLQVSAGLAIAPDGSVLFLPADTSTGVQDLIDKSAQIFQSPTPPAGSGTFQDCTTVTVPPVTTASAGTLFLITLSAAEALCGAEDVFGKLCEEACVTSTDRPYVVEGIVLRAIPLLLKTPLPTSKAVPLTIKHLRSQVASAYFADERLVMASLISGAGLKSGVWCFGADGPSGREVPLGVIVRSGSKTVFLDAWTARREAIETTARRYWAWRMATRPWDVFLAQILQFQCQLRDAVASGGSGSVDPCPGQTQIIRQASDTFGQLRDFYEAVTTRFSLQPLLSAGAAANAQPPDVAGGLAAVSGLFKRLATARDATQLQSNRILIDNGIVQLPSAGYLPVDPGSALTVNQQVAQWMGAGVDLRFCVVRPDFVPHALEEAQHMERISLLQGLDDPNKLERVDILVPDGETASEAPAAGTAFQATLQFPAGFTTGNIGGGAPPLSGAARIDISDANGAQFFLSTDSENPASAILLRTNLSRLSTSLFGVAAGASLGSTSGAATGAASGAATDANTPPTDAVWLAVTCSQNPFSPAATGTANIEIRVIAGDTSTPPLFENLWINGVYRFGRAVATSLGSRITGTLSGTYSVASNGSTLPGGQLPPIEIDLLLSPPTQTQPATLKATASLSNNSTVNAPSYLITFQWAGSPLVVNFGVALQNIRRNFQLLSGVLQQNPDVLAPTNTFHTLALHGLKIVSDDIGDSSFAGIAGNQLFPPAPPATGGLIVKATLDWVLFVRRREKQCGAALPAPTPLPSRRYRVYHRHVTASPNTADNVEQIRGALTSNNTSFFQQNQIAFTIVDEVEFGAGIATLETPAAKIAGDWGLAKPAVNIVYGAIGSQGAAVDDGDGLALDRLDDLEQTLKTSVGAALDIAAGPDVLKQIPSPPLDATNVDGVIVLLTQSDTQTIPFAMNASATPTTIPPGAIEPVGDFLLTGSGGKAGQTVPVIFSYDTGKVPIANPASNPPTLSIDGGAPIQPSQVGGTTATFNAVPLTFPGTAGNVTLRLSNVLVDSRGFASGAPGQVDMVVTTNPAEPVDKPLQVVANVTPNALGVAKTARLFLWRDGPAGGRILTPTAAPLVITFTANNTLAGSLPNELFQFVFQGVEYDTGSTTADPGAAKRLKSLMAALKAAKRLAASPVSRTTSLAAVEGHFLTDNNVAVSDVIFLALNKGLVV